MEQLPAAYLARTGVYMKNLYIFEGCCLVQGIVSPYSIILMGNRLPVLGGGGGLLLPAAEVT